MHRLRFTYNLLALGFLATASLGRADYTLVPHTSPFPEAEGHTFLQGILDDGSVLFGAFTYQPQFEDLGIFLDHGTRLEPISLPSGFSPTEIDSSGTMVGNTYGSFPPFSAPFLLSPGGALTKLRVPGVNPRGYGLNGRGDVAGSVGDTSQRVSGFVAREGKARLYDYPGSIFTELDDVNDAGWAVGRATLADYTPKAFVTNGRQKVDLEVELPPYGEFVPRFINNEGRIAGTIAVYTESGYVRTQGIYFQGRLEPIDSPKQWPAEIVVDDYGFPRTLTFVQENFVINGLNNKGEIAATSVATYRDSSGFTETFTATYIGHP